MAELAKEWSPARTIEKVLHRAVLLNEPDTSDPVRPDVAALYLTSNEDYRRAAREATQAYAV
ncbi:ubiquitin-conjugating enzyme E2 [Streptomyces sp. NPDC051994]|uniref:ubiquitin-conjugating enzyme E2 n=1 Tax=unclassified Streptomyces TaxID=2593676 RepID=UPI0034269CA9